MGKKKAAAAAAGKTGASQETQAAPLAHTGDGELPACVRDSLDNARALMAAGAYSDEEAAQFLCDSDPAFFPTLKAGLDALKKPA